jgi:trans-2,3-dihydro-3-hydroxyanthranilate isomerase
MRRKFHTLDVFTRVPLAGNPLAVVLDSDGLDTARMQAIAREFNLSETVFVLPSRDPVNTARVRIFTPAQELPFAGHPTIGTAILLAELRAPDVLAREDVRVVLEEAVGPVACMVRHVTGQAPRARFDIPKLPEPASALGSRVAITEALGLAEADIGFAGHEPRGFSAGVSFAFVPIAGRAALARAKPITAHWQAAFGAGRLPAYLYCKEPEGKGHAWRARMFGPEFGIVEDPATGSAAAAFAGVVMAHEKPTDGEHAFIIEQGFEMGRPSLITVGLEVANGTLKSASIGGEAVMLMQGIVDA